MKKLVLLFVSTILVLSLSGCITSPEQTTDEKSNETTPPVEDTIIPEVEDLDEETETAVEEAEANMPDKEAGKDLEDFLNNQTGDLQADLETCNGFEEERLVSSCRIDVLTSNAVTNEDENLCRQIENEDSEEVCNKKVQQKADEMANYVEPPEEEE